jgi:hypothetical protein
MWSTRHPRATAASAISWRWQRHGTASAHMTVVGRSAAAVSTRSSAAWNSGDAV